MSLESCLLGLENASKNISRLQMHTPLISSGPLNSIIVDLNKPYIIRNGRELSDLEYLPTKTQYTEHQENHITCGRCGTTLLMQTTLSHTPTNNGGDIILVVVIHPPQIYHNLS